MHQSVLVIHKNNDHNQDERRCHKAVEIQVFCSCATKQASAKSANAPDALRISFVGRVSVALFNMHIQPCISHHYVPFIRVKPTLFASLSTRR